MVLHWEQQRFPNSDKEFLFHPLLLGLPEEFAFCLDVIQKHVQVNPVVSEFAVSGIACEMILITNTQAWCYCFCLIKQQVQVNVSFLNLE